MPFFQPVLALNDSAKATDNATALNDALGRYVNGINPPPKEGLILLLPKGKIYTDQINITEARRGLVIQGSGTETKLINRAGGMNPYVIAAAVTNFGYADALNTYTPPTDQVTLAAGVNAANYSANDVLWLFEVTNANTRCPFQQRFVLVSRSGSTLTLSGNVTQGGLQAKYTKGGRVATINSDRQSVTVSPLEDADNFPVDTWCFLADGAAQNTMYGEFVRVTDNNPGTGLVTFDDFIRRGDYQPGAASDPNKLTALISGPFLQNLAFRDLTFGGQGQAGGYSLQADGCVGLTLENMQFELGDPEADQGVLGLTTCRRVTLTNCRTPILKNPDDNLRDAVGLNGAQNVAFYGGEIAGFVCEEFSREIECHGTRLSGDFGVRPNCEDVRVYGGDHMLRYFGANGDRFHMSGCRVYAVAFGIVGASPGLVGVEFQAPIVHVLESPCKNAFIAGIRVGPGGSIGLAVGSTGQYLPAMGGGTINDLTGGGWTAIS